MVRTNIAHDVVANEIVYAEYAGESLYTKPAKFGTRTVVVNGQQTTKDIGISTGSLFVEVDTGDVYAWSDTDSEWKKICALGGSGDE